ncbi:MAG: hypothetical protein N3A58_09135 [Spirochaetes bacterium]|nr:hypothetical protein [Spirochaetota bacterium]
MKINNISAYNFRNFENIFIDNFGNNIFIYGKNGSGKTNFLELIYFTYHFKSFRNIKENLICKRDEQFFSIELDDSFSKRKIIYFKDKGKKLNYIGGEKFKKIFVPYLNSRYMIYFYYSSENRRSYFDKFLLFIDEKYKELISKYYEIINTKKSIILKNLNNRNFIVDQFLILNENLSELIFDISKIRSDFIINLNRHISQIDLYWDYKIKYNSYFNEKDKYLIKKILNNYIDDEIRLKRYKGIHNDKFEFLKSDLKIELTGSYADFKIFFIILNFALISYYKEIFGFYPVILFDDYFQEIDIENIRKISLIINKIFNNNTQIFFSSSKKFDEISKQYFIDINFDNFFIIENNVIKESLNYHFNE